MEWLVLVSVAVVAVGYLWWSGRDARRADGAGGSGSGDGGSDHK